MVANLKKSISYIQRKKEKISFLRNYNQVSESIFQEKTTHFQACIKPININQAKDQTILFLFFVTSSSSHLDLSI
jgi:hypothetical protein